MELLGEFGAGAMGVIALELLFVVRLWVRARRKDLGPSLVEDAHRLGLRQRRRRLVFPA